MPHNPPDRQKLSIFELVQVAKRTHHRDGSSCAIYGRCCCRSDALEVVCCAEIASMSSSQTEGLNGEAPFRAR